MQEGTEWSCLFYPVGHWRVKGWSQVTLPGGMKQDAGPGPLLVVEGLVEGALGEVWLRQKHFF